MGKRSTYVDGFVFIVPKDKLAEYKTMAKEANELWMKYGALSYRECQLEDPEPTAGQKEVDSRWQPMTFLELAKPSPDETVWFSYIEYESKAHRDEVNAKVMSDSSMKSDDPDHMAKMPFDIKRMAYGGFSVEVEGTSAQDSK